MAGLDELFAQIPVQDIAAKLGADQGEVNSAIRTLVPALVGGLQANVQADDIDSSGSGGRASAHRPPAACWTAGSTSTRWTPAEGDKIVANIFGGNDSNSVASALAGDRRRQRRPDQEAAADPGADRAGLYRQAVRRATPRPRSRRPHPRAVGSAMCSAASSAAPVAAGTIRWAASWAACSAGRRPGRQSGQCHRRTFCGGLLGGKK